MHRLGAETVARRFVVPIIDGAGALSVIRKEILLDFTSIILVMITLIFCIRYNYCTTLIFLFKKKIYFALVTFLKVFLQTRFVLTL